MQIIESWQANSSIGNTPEFCSHGNSLCSSPRPLDFNTLVIFCSSSHPLDFNMLVIFSSKTLKRVTNGSKHIYMRVGSSTRGAICKYENGTLKVARNAFNIGEVWNPVGCQGNKTFKLILFCTFSRTLLQKIKHFC